MLGMRFEPLFYHKSFDRFVPWEQREKTMVFSCTMGCSAHNLTAKEARDHRSVEICCVSKRLDPSLSP